VYTPPGAVGLGYAAVGCMFAAVGAAAAQLTEGAGAARGIGLGALGVAFVLRLAGDVGGAAISWLSWLSPIGWGQQLRPYADARWWVLALAVGFVAAVTAAAVAVSARRDVGGGLVRPRPGPAVASPRLRRPLGLAWRLHRGPLIGWTAGFAAIGVPLGASAEGIGDLVGVAPEFEEILVRVGGQAALVDAYLAAMLSFLALLASGFAIQATLRMRTEEAGERAEPVLAAAVGRLRWAASHLAFALLGPAVALTAGGLAIGLSYGLTAGDVAGQTLGVLAGALVQLPAVWVLAGIAVAAFGLLPALAAAVSWGALGAFVLLGQFGPVLRLDQWVLNLSPYTHVPNLPGDALTMTPLLWLVVVAAGFTLAGLGGFRRRDVPVG
jgi:ABC-2 type transport system permease protein